MSHEPHDLAGVIWGRLGEKDAEALNQIAATISHREMAARLGALAHRVIKGDVDPPSASSWLARQRPGRGADP